MTWISAATHLPAGMSLYDRLFTRHKYSFRSHSLTANCSQPSQLDIVPSLCHSLPMLVIRPAQMAEFAKSAERHFKERLERHLISFLPERGVVFSQEEIKEQVERGVTQCLKLGLERQCDIARCLEIICGLAGGFNAGPLPREALRILYAYRVDPVLKLDRLQAWAVGSK